MPHENDSRVLADLEYLEQHISQATPEELYENATEIYNLAARNIGKINGTPDEDLKSRYMSLVNTLLKYLPSQPQKAQVPKPPTTSISIETKKVFDPKDLSDWFMTENEQKLFLEYISGAKVYLEFGSGGSTVATLMHSTAQVYSVEASSEWICSLRKKFEIIEKSEKEGRLQLIYADIGNVGNWSYPVKEEIETNKEKFSNYHKHIFSQHPQIKQADIVLIDGRFRVACCLQILLEMSKNTTIIIHDYWVRPEYHILKKYVTYIDGVDKSMVCKRKMGVSDNDILTEYEKYIYEYL